MTPDPKDEHARWIRSALDRYERPLVSYASRLCSDLDAARDAVQETFLRLCREPRAKVEARLAPWLYTVCRRLAVDQRRHTKRAAMVDPSSLDVRGGPGDAPDAGAERHEAADRALAAVYRLPERPQEVILLKFRHGLSYREIAEVTGFGESYVGVLIHEGKTALRAVLKPDAEPQRSRATGEGGAR